MSVPWCWPRYVPNWRRTAVAPGLDGAADLVGRFDAEFARVRDALDLAVTGDLTCAS